VAAASFAILSASPSMFGLAGHATHFVVLPALAGCWGILWPGKRERLAPLLAGVAFGVAFLMKQQAATLMLFGLLFVLWRSRAAGARVAVTRSGLFALGAVAPYAVLCACLASAGVFGNFWFWTVTYARDYVSTVPLSQAFGILRENAAMAIGPNAPLWVIAAVGACCSCAQLRPRPGREGVLRGIAAVLVPGGLPGLLLPTALLHRDAPRGEPSRGAGRSSLSSQRTRRRGPRQARLGARGSACDGDRGRPAASALLPVGHDDGQPRALRQEPVPGIDRDRPVHRFELVARDRIAVLGSEPQLYFYAHRQSATRYVYAYALMEPHPHAGQLQDQVIREIEAAKPLFAVFVDVPMSWLARPSSDRRIQQWMSTYLPAHYETVGVVEIPPDGSTRYVWGEPAAGTQATEPYVVLVLRRRD
jgi:hypothetical protein